jgi:hypothetical protein
VPGSTPGNLYLSITHLHTLFRMVLDGGVLSGGAITSTFTAVLRISQAVYELKAVGEQTRDLLDTTKYVNASLESVRELRRKKSDILNREEKKWMDQQIEFTQNAVDSVAVLIERARVDMQAKNETGNEDDYKTKHIKIHHRARFVLQDSPKVLTNLSKVTMAMNGLNSVMVTLSSREGHDVHLQPSRGNFGRSRSSAPKAPPPPYAEHEFLHHRRTVNRSVEKKQVPQKLGFLAPEDQEAVPVFGSQTVPHQPLHPRASMSSITPSINFSSTRNDAYHENAIADETTSPPACLPTAFIRDSIGSDEYFGPFELDNTTSTPSDTYEMDASTRGNVLYTLHSAPAVPTIPRKPLEYQTMGYHRHRASTPSMSSVHDEFEQHLANPWASSTPHSHSPHRPPLETQKDLPMLPLNVAPTPSHHPTGSTVSLSSTLGDPSMGTPPVSRGRSWLIDRATQAAAGNVSPISRTQSNASSLPSPYPYHSPDSFGAVPGRWAEMR